MTPSERAKIVVGRLAAVWGQPLASEFMRNDLALALDTFAADVVREERLRIAQRIDDLPADDGMYEATKLVNELRARTPASGEECGCNQEGEHGPNCPAWCEHKAPRP